MFGIGRRAVQASGRDQAADNGPRCGASWGERDDKRGGGIGIEGFHGTDGGPGGGKWNG